MGELVRFGAFSSDFFIVFFALCGAVVCCVEPLVGVLFLAGELLMIAFSLAFLSASVFLSDADQQKAVRKDRWTILTFDVSLAHRRAPRCVAYLR